MGSAASKPEAKVFTPSAPVDLSASFLAHLENSQESDYTRSQYTESYIQERVAKELTRLEAEAIGKFKKTASDAVSKDNGSKVSVASTNDKIEALTKSLRESSELVRLELSENVQKLKLAVLQCLKDNQGKPLNCWDEVTEFKKLVHGL
ncbi:hypothetical protein PUMCH_000499 [Australozyma saopauloensis]|uniref:MICOS complex subunit MIC19 n=1 Tax=Australozyma saopauloensis TaxID=291208 RepID=A0AAX4H4M2_9ASCO|nr:hypothetical protein PUMCH_000499 [[Candida] saopauloensis]